MNPLNWTSRQLIAVRAVLTCVLVFMVAPLAQAAPPSVSVSLNPASGVAPYTSTLTWSATNAASCAASDGWTGAKALTGTQQVTVTAATKYTLTCVAADGALDLVWTPPTTNTDGSAFTNLAGFNIYRGTTATNLAKLKSIAPDTTTYADTGLASGSYFYAITAYNSATPFAESVQSRATPYPVTVAGSSSSASTSADVTKTPSSVTGFTITVSNQTTIKVTPAQ